MDLQEQISGLAQAFQEQALIETDPVDFVEFILQAVGYRDLDAIADDIVCVVLRSADLRHHVRERLDRHLDFLRADHPVPAAEPRRAAEEIVAAVRAIVRGHCDANGRT